MKDKKNSNQSFLRATALLVGLVGAVGSLYFMFSASRKQNSLILLGLFTAWVLSPFIGMFISIKFSKRWTVTTRSLLYWLIIVLTIGSLVAYSGAFNIPQKRNAFIFLIVPLISWILLIVTVLAARRFSRKTNLKSSNSNIKL